MFYKTRKGLIALGLSLPLISSAIAGGVTLTEVQTTPPPLCRMPSSDKLGSGICSFTFAVTPTYANLCIADVLSHTYTITNNTPVPVLINSIGIISSDSLPALASVIVASPTNSCVAGTRVAAGASCNITLNLQPLAGTLGTSFNRFLRVGVDTRQVFLNGPAITSAVNCSPAAPAAPSTPTVPVVPSGSTSILFGTAILGTTTVTNTGLSVVNGDVDVSPGTAVTGFPPGVVTNGTIRLNDAQAVAVQTAAGNYYNSLIAQACTVNEPLIADIGGQTLTPGVYCFPSSAAITGTLTLNGAGNYTFKIGSTLVTATGSNVILTNGATKANVNWAVGSSATLGTNSILYGIIDAAVSITLNTGANLQGWAWTQNSTGTGGAVTLDTNVVNPGT